MDSKRKDGACNIEAVGDEIVRETIQQNYQKNATMKEDLENQQTF